MGELLLKKKSEVGKVKTPTPLFENVIYKLNLITNGLAFFFDHKKVPTPLSVYLKTDQNYL